MKNSRGFIFTKYFKGVLSPIVVISGKELWSVLFGESTSNGGFKYFESKNSRTFWYWPQNAVLFACRGRLAPYAGTGGYHILPKSSRKESAQQVCLNYWTKTTLTKVFATPQAHFVAVVDFFSPYSNSEKKYNSGTIMNSSSREVILFFCFLRSAWLAQDVCAVMYSAHVPFFLLIGTIGNSSCLCGFFSSVA